MTFYILLLFSLMIFGMIVFHSRKEAVLVGFNHKRITMQEFYCFIVATILVLLIGLRATSVGSDTQIYSEQYYNSYISFDSFIEEYLGFVFKGPKYFFSTKNKSLFLLISSLFNSLGVSYNAFLIVCALLFVAPLYYLIERDSKNVCMSTFWFMILFFSLSLTGVRITMAMGFTTLSYIFFKKNHKVICVVMVMLAIMIHLSAVVFVFYYVFRKLKLSKKALYILIPVFVITPIVGKVIMPIIMKYTYYSEVSDNMTWNLTYYSFLVVTSVLLILVYPDPNNDYILMSVIGTLVFGMVNYGSLANIYKYMIISHCIVLPGVSIHIKNRSLRIVVDIFYLACGVYWYLRIFTPTSKYVPYLFFWQ